MEEARFKPRQSGSAARFLTSAHNASSDSSRNCNFSLLTASFLTGTQSGADSCPAQYFPFLQTSKSVFQVGLRAWHSFLPSFSVSYLPGCSTDQLPTAPPYCCLGSRTEDRDGLWSAEARWTLATSLILPFRQLPHVIILMLVLMASGIIPLGLKGS